MKNADMPAMPQVVAEDSRGNGLVGSHMEEEWQGLTKREMFAMHVMSSVIGGIMANNDPSAKTTPKETSELAVAYADALLAELDK